MHVFCLLIYSFCICIHSSGAVLKNYYWRDYVFGDIPYDAIEIANDGKYIGQAYVDGGLLPVTIYPYNGFAIGELFGKVIVKDNIQILCTPDPCSLYWDLVDFKKPTNGQMRNTIMGGFYKDALNYFIGKIHHEGEWKGTRKLPERWAKVVAFDDNAKPHTANVVKIDFEG
ncbi:hypothetical protein Trydic_g1650 [Trypoxylus dichotomus]